MKHTRLLVFLGLVLVFVAIVGVGQLGGEENGGYITPPSQLTTEETYTPSKTGVPGAFPYSIAGQGGQVSLLLLFGVFVLLLWWRRKR